MGEWTINPTGRTATLTVEGNNAKVSVSENTGSSITYTVKFRQGDYCGEYTFTQEGTTPPQPPGPDECGYGHDPCRDCLGQVGVDFVITNNHGSTIKINPGVKLKVNKSPYTGSFDYCAPKVGGVYVPIEITNGGTVTIEHNEMEFVEESTIVIPGEWECLGEEASFMDGQPIEGAYVYDVNGMRDISCTISPSTFTAGTPDSPIRYEVTIP